MIEYEFDAGPVQVNPGRVPRVSRLRCVSRARVSQVLNLLCLAPDIQEAILFLPEVESGRDPVGERDLRGVCAELEWAKQHALSRFK